MRVNRSFCSWVVVLLGLVFFAVTANVLMGGLQALIKFRSAVQTDLPISLDSLHYFTLESLERRLQTLTVKSLPTESPLPEYRLYATENDLELLVSDLPESAKLSYVSGHMNLDQSGTSNEVEFRYRGGLPLHWLYEKKSLRVKLPPYRTFRGERQFNIVNPSTIQTITDWVSYDISRSLGLLTPDYFPLRLFINNEYNGVHFFLSRVDESFLRKNRRMPGSIYSGDTLFIPSEFGKKSGKVTLEQTFFDEQFVARLWKDARIWKKSAARNAENSENREDLEKYIEIINTEDPDRFKQLFEDYFDKEKVYLYLALDTLTGTYHHDNFHNHKLYFDPYKGKFEPIEWDIRYWSSDWEHKDLPQYPLLKRIKLNPFLEFERDQVAYRLMQKYTVSEMFNRIDTARERVESELSADPFRQYPDHRYSRFKFNKEVPFSMAEFEQSIEYLKATYKKRYQYLKEVYQNVGVVFQVKRYHGDSSLLTISVSGNSPALLDLSELSAKLKNTYTIQRYMDGNVTQVPPDNQIEILFPGRKVTPGNVIGRADQWGLLSFGIDKVEEAPLIYQYLLNGVSPEGIKDALTEMPLVNAITGSVIKVSEANIELDSKLPTIHHPWNYQDALDPNSKLVEFSGVVDILEDRIYDETQQINILPGTEFRLGKGKSLVFYGKVTALGTGIQPIVFKPLTSEPWGSLVIQGEHASGSHFSHVEVFGGSLLSHRLINYPGQINIHDVTDFTLESCFIHRNHVGDDSLHIAYATGLVENCRFEDTAFDAVDIDIADVKMQNLEFTNIGNDALDLMTSRVQVSNLYVKGAGDKCISVGEESDLVVANASLANCEIGIAVKDQSKADLTEVDFQENREKAISLYQKNPRYGSGGTVTGNRVTGITSWDIDIGPSSNSLLEFAPATQGGG